MERLDGVIRIQVYRGDLGVAHEVAQHIGNALAPQSVRWHGAQEVRIKGADSMVYRYHTQR
eukprot:419411-Prymnesium_polylepis.1